MKVKHSIKVTGPFPGIFTRMANLTSDFYQGKPAAEISPTLPAGMVAYREKFVRSLPISPPGAKAQCYINGRFDAVIAFEDGSYGVVDYKTSEAKDEQADFYARQLTAYAYALEHPAQGALSLAPVSRLGLFIVTPERFERNAAGEVMFVNRTTWVDVPRDDAAFLALLGEVMGVLEAPTPPEPGETCGLCAYRREMEAR
jgi:hypothetical protein